MRIKYKMADNYKNSVKSRRYIVYSIEVQYICNIMEPNFVSEDLIWPEANYTI